MPISLMDSLCMRCGVYVRLEEQLPGAAAAAVAAMAGRHRIDYILYYIYSKP